MTYGYSPSLTCNATLPGPSLAEMCGASAFIVFMSLLDELIRSNDKISGRCERVKPIETPDEEYDFVVIGGGGVGAVVAARLSENPDWKILLLEAGDDEPAGAQVPLFTGSVVGSAVDWNYMTRNESYACLANNGSCSLPSGKVLGGGTTHNSMIYLRGNPKDYNNWAEQGNEGWTWEEVEPFFIKSEDNGEIDRVGRKHHGTGGPLSVERFPYLPQFGYSILEAAEELGYSVNEDLAGDQITGFTIVQTSSQNGVRRSSAAAFLRPARDRKNLHVSLNSLVARVIIENDQAVGVEYYQNDQLKTVRASREVILSAGAINSPQILLLSGIGPSEHLSSVGVEVVKDLPGVGENFHNHVAFVVSFTIDEEDKYDNDWIIATQYLVNQTGPLSGNGIDGVTAILNTESASPDFPDIQFNFGGYAESCAPGEIGELHSAGKRTVDIRAVNIHPKSKGRISLVSNDPFEYPAIWANYFGDSSDLDLLVKAVELGLELADTQALRSHGITLSTTPIEACSNYTFPSTKYWACAVQQTSAAQLHLAGSCKMGPPSDPMAVVDSRLRVHGINGLRVADNSIMPQVISGNTGAPAMMIGERAADFIKKDWESVEKTFTHTSSSKCYLKHHE